MSQVTTSASALFKWLLSKKKTPKAGRGEGCRGEVDCREREREREKSLLTIK
jgi:hypothetical protein